MNVTSDNVVQILEAAERIQAIDMKKHALRLIVQNFSKVRYLKFFKGLSIQTNLVTGGPNAASEAIEQRAAS